MGRKGLGWIGGKGIKELKGQHLNSWILKSPGIKAGGREGGREGREEVREPGGQVLREYGRRSPEGSWQGRFSGGVRCKELDGGREGGWSSCCASLRG